MNDLFTVFATFLGQQVHCQKSAPLSMSKAPSSLKLEDFGVDPEVFSKLENDFETHFLNQTGQKPQQPILASKKILESLIYDPLSKNEMLAPTPKEPESLANHEEFIDVTSISDVEAEPERGAYVPPPQPPVIIHKPVAVKRAYCEDEMKKNESGADFQEIQAAPENLQSAFAAIYKHTEENLKAMQFELLLRAVTQQINQKPPLPPLLPFSFPNIFPPVQPLPPPTPPAPSQTGNSSWMPPEVFRQILNIGLITSTASSIFPQAMENETYTPARQSTRKRARKNAQEKNASKKFIPSNILQNLPQTEDGQCNYKTKL